MGDIMTVNALNELLQWLTLVGLLLLTLAIYRRLGLMFIDAREYKLSQFGPAVGESGERLLQAVFGSSDPQDATSLIVYSQEHCSVCEDLVQHLAGMPSPIGVRIGVVTDGSDAYQRKVSSALPTATVRNGAQIETQIGSKPTSFPLTLLLDRTGRIGAKVLGADFDAIETATKASSFRFPNSGRKEIEHA